jgi:uncharacterized Zn finger protein (UPF0148 family)
MTDEHCPECGAYGSVRREPFETLVICPNDDCPRIIISVNSRVVAPPATGDCEAIKP